jgi:hypothetical protein
MTIYILGAVVAMGLVYLLFQARAATPAARERRTKPVDGDGHDGSTALFVGDSTSHGKGSHGGTSPGHDDAGSSHHFGTDHGAGTDTGGFDSGGSDAGGGGGGGGGD